MTSRTSYELADAVATITFDDGKVNALSLDAITELSAELARAEASDAKAIVLIGRERTLSAGFDLRTAADGWGPMMAAGGRLAAQILACPKPVVIGCTGNAIAMGALLLLSADRRIGADGAFKIGLNEVKIGLTLPWFGIALAEGRLSRPALEHCVNTGVLLDPGAAREAGFLDVVVPEAELAAAAHAAAVELTELNPVAHAATKLRIRRDLLTAVNDGVDRLSGDDISQW